MANMKSEERELIKRRIGAIIDGPSVQPSPCPYCGRQPDIEPCEPWPRSAGPQPWYAGCYQAGEREHFVGCNGDSKADAIKNWEREVAKYAASPAR